MLRLIKNRQWEWMVILLLGLSPFLWFDSQTVIMGHDSGLVLNPIEHFIDRLSTWTERFNMGADQYYAIPGFFIHGLDALVYWCTHNISLTQKITFIFWFALPGLTMMLLVKSIGQRYKLPYIALPASIFYMFNHFLLQGWFVAERTKFSLYGALPLYLYLLFEWSGKRLSTPITAVAISAVFFFLNGLASPPLFGGILLATVVFILFYGILYRQLWRLIVLFSLVILLSTILQAYWLFPMIDFLKHSYAQTVDLYGGKAGIAGWVKYISEQTSLYNLFRLQGIPEWYQNPLHPYAQTMLNNPFFSGMNFILPIIAFLPLYLYRKNHKLLLLIIFLSTLALISIAFSAGAHPPFGLFYIFLMEYVPGFIAFRTPFYKFAPALWFSYAILISLSINWIVEKWRHRNRWIPFFVISFWCVSILVFNYPFFTGVFFDYIREQRTMRLSIPQYVTEYFIWSQSADQKHKRTLFLPLPNPDSSIDAYSWGYWSLAPLSTLASSANIINRSYFTSPLEQQIISQLAEYLRVSDHRWKKLSQIIGIDYIVVRKDFAWNLPNTPGENPQLYDKLRDLNGMTYMKSFGMWDVYSIDAKTSRIEISDTFSVIDSPSGDIPKLVSMPVFDATLPLLQAVDVSLQASDDNIAARYSVAKCNTCNLQWKFINLDLYRPLLTQDSNVYPLYQLFHSSTSTITSNSSLQLQQFAYTLLSDTLGYQKVLDEQKSENKVSVVQGALQRSLKNFSSALQKSDIALTTERRIEILSILRNIKSIQTQLKATESQKEFVLQYKAEIDSLFTLIDEKTWRTQTASSKKLELTLTKSGPYHIYYRPNAQLESDRVQIAVNGVPRIVQMSVAMDNWHDLGIFDLPMGTSQIEVNQKTVNEYAQKMPMIFQKGTFLCQKSDAIRGNMNDIYRIQFSHTSKDESGEFYISLLPESLEPSERTGLEKLTSTSQVRQYTNDYAVGGKQNFVVHICNSITRQNISAIDLHIFDISIVKLSIPDIVAYSGTALAKKPYHPTVTKHSSSMYEFDLPATQSPQVITLKNSYSPRWVFGDSSSVPVWGFANGWIISDSNNSAVRLEYAPDRIVRIGFATTLVGTIGIAIYWAYRFKKIHHEKKLH